MRGTLRVVAVAAGLAAGCGDGGSGAPDGGRDAAVSTDGAPADAAQAAPEITSGPTLTMAPNASTPLVGVLELSTDVLTTVSVEIDDGSDARVLVFDQTEATDHSLPLLGFTADGAFTVTATVHDASGASTSAAPIAATTDPLPGDFPGFTVVSDPAAMEPGVTMFNAADYLIAVDPTGEVVWYHRALPAPRDARRLASGNLLYLDEGRQQMVEIDMLGNVIERWYPAGVAEPVPGAVAVATDSFHHEAFEMASGNLLLLSSEQRTYDGYPTSESDPTPNPEPTNVVGDVVVEVARDGTVAWEWRLLDILDPFRLGWDSMAQFFWADYYPGGGADWSHGNAVIHDPSDDTIIVSLRHQDAVVKINRDGQIVWILGPHDNWSAEYQPYLLEPPAPDFLWPFHQHAPMLTPSGGLLVFDNGNHRASPPDPDQTELLYSRVVEFDIDEVAMTVDVAWEYDAGQTLYARFLGDADHLPVTGNVLGAFGADFQVLEVTRDDPAEVVFQLTLDELASLYRAERLPSLYP